MTVQDSSIPVTIINIVDNSTIEASGGKIQVKDEGITSTQIKDGGITAEDISDGINPFSIHGLSILIFQVTPATGTASTPEKINDGATDVYGSADTINKYWEIDLGGVYLVNKYRGYGGVGQTGDGRYKFQGYSPKTETWIDLVTDVPVFDSPWMDWVLLPEIFAISKIKIICTTVDTVGNNRIVEMEFKGEL